MQLAEAGPRRSLRLFAIVTAQKGRPVDVAPTQRSCSPRPTRFPRQSGNLSRPKTGFDFQINPLGNLSRPTGGSELQMDDSPKWQTT